jgi:hypothetical protein
MFFTVFCAVLAALLVFNFPVYEVFKLIAVFYRALRYPKDWHLR